MDRERDEGCILCVHCNVTGIAARGRNESMKRRLQASEVLAGGGTVLQRYVARPIEAVGAANQPKEPGAG